MSKPHSPRYPVKKVVAAIYKAKGMLYIAAKMVGCHINTITQYKKRYAEVREAVENAGAEEVDIAEIKLFQAVRAGNLQAVMFLLTTKGRDRGYGRSVNIDLDGEIKKLMDRLTGGDNAPLELEIKDEAILEVMETNDDAATAD